MDDDQLLPCPFCGSTHLSQNEWSADDGEFPAIECDDCLGSAPAAVWNARADTLKDPGPPAFLSEALNMGDGAYRP